MTREKNPWEYITRKPRNLPAAPTDKEGPNAVSIDTPSWFHLEAIDKPRPASQGYKKMVYHGHNQVLLQADVAGGERGPAGTTLLTHGLCGGSATPVNRPTLPRRPSQRSSSSGPRGRTPRTRPPRGRSNLSTAMSAGESDSGQQPRAHQSPAARRRTNSGKSNGIRAPSATVGSAQGNEEGEPHGPTLATTASVVGSTLRAKGKVRGRPSHLHIDRPNGSAPRPETATTMSSRRTMNTALLDAASPVHAPHRRPTSRASSIRSFSSRLGVSFRSSPRKADWRGPTPPPQWAGVPVVARGVLQVTTPATRPRLFGRLRPPQG